MRNVSFFNINAFGNLGNQFFNILSAIGTAESLGLPLYCTGLSRLDEFFDINYPFLNSVVIENPQCLSKYNDLSEIEVEKYGSLILYGYMIRPGYFGNINIKNVIRPKFAPIQSGDKVVIFNVRLGDYVTQYSEYFTVLPQTDYYEQAKKIFKAYKIYIVTDTPALARTFFNEEVLELSVEECLAFLVGAQNIVCANSTFSWMGAALSNAKRIVVPDIYNKEKFEKNRAEDFWTFQTDIIEVNLKDTNRNLPE